MKMAAAAATKSRRLRVLLRAEGPLRSQLATLLARAGYEVVAAAEDADAVLAEEESGFAEMREHSRRALLTPREIEILDGIGQGLTNKMIARRLQISLHTVKFHVESVFRKLGVRSRAEAVARALERQRREEIEL